MKTHQCPSRRPHHVPFRSQAGFSMIELMIAITIGLVIITSLVGILAASSSGSATNDRTSEILSNGRYALNSVKEELREAGFRGYTWALPSTPSPWTDPTSGCFDTGGSAATFITNLDQGVWGSDNANPFPANCIPSTSYLSGTDVLVIRRVSNTPVTSPLKANTVYFQSSYSQGKMFRSTSVPTAPTFTGQLPLGTFTLNTSVYYVSPFTTTASENPLVPALWRVSLQSDGTMAKELVASNIERMQVQYGIPTTVPDDQFYDTIAGTSYETTSTDGTVNWGNVGSVRLWLLARNSTAEPGYKNTQTYTMGNQSYTVNDGFRRQLFTTVVSLRNMGVKQ
jgi:type IV pilus assembly protein PilW